jgi:superfamily II DNA or RNA helicase
MVLCQTLDSINSIADFTSVYNDDLDPSQHCKQYSSRNTVEERKKILEEFKNKKFKTLVVCGCLKEGFDHPNVSIVAIARNVGANSHVLFAQFVGRALRLVNRKEPATLKAAIISHPEFNQRINFEIYDKYIAENYPDGEELVI